MKRPRLDTIAGTKYVVHKGELETNKPNSQLVNDRHHDTTDDHGNKIPKYA
jgi:hypothetical protein